MPSYIYKRTNNYS
ncbi:uncharacterized protein FFB20_15863 [Fusarium fujikuroi]|nr:uncharacterized protein FFB20_15863 [Fusarium fujikuroi]